MRNSIFFATACLLLLSSACKKEDKSEHTLSAPPDVYVENYIETYIEPNIVSITGTDDNNFNKNRIFSCYITGARISNYDSLMRMYHDEDFCARRYVKGPVVLASRIDSVNIVSDADYDESHPKGSDLTDIFTFTLFSDGPFVLSHYDRTFIEYGSHIHIKKKWAETNNEERTLLAADRPHFVHVDTLPSLSQVHNMTFTFYFANGKVLSATQQMDFGKVK